MEKKFEIAAIFCAIEGLIAIIKLKKIILLFIRIYEYLRPFIRISLKNI